MVTGGTELDSEARALYSHPHCDKGWGFLGTPPAWPGSVGAGERLLFPGGRLQPAWESSSTARSFGHDPGAAHEQAAYPGTSGRRLSRGEGTEVVLLSLLLGTPQTSSLCPATCFSADSQEGIAQAVV